MASVTSIFVHADTLLLKVSQIRRRRQSRVNTAQNAFNDVSILWLTVKTQLRSFRLRVLIFSTCTPRRVCKCDPTLWATNVQTFNSSHVRKQQRHVIQHYFIQYSIFNVCGRGIRLITHIHLVLRLRMFGTTPPLPHTPSWRALLFISAPSSAFSFKHEYCTAKS